MVFSLPSGLLFLYRTMLVENGENEWFACMFYPFPFREVDIVYGFLLFPFLVLMPTLFPLVTQVSHWVFSSLSTVAVHFFLISDKCSYVENPYGCVDCPTSCNNLVFCLAFIYRTFSLLCGLSCTGADDCTVLTSVFRLFALSTTSVNEISTNQNKRISCAINLA